MTVATVDIAWTTALVRVDDHRHEGGRSVLPVRWWAGKTSPFDGAGQPYTMFNRSSDASRCGCHDQAGRR